jgi:D-alanyl-D-alanine carboxypeptidase
MQFRYYLGIIAAVFTGIIISLLAMEGFSYSYGFIARHVDFPWSREMGAESSGIYEYEDGSLASHYTKMDNSIDFPKVTAKSYLIADLDTGEIIESRDPDAIYSIASISKLMTALVSVETIDQYSQINVPKFAVDTLGKQGGLRTGEILSANELLHALLLESSNDAAEALAVFAGRDDFMKNMNNRAESLGLARTSFLDPSGLSSGNKSTVSDLFRLVQYLRENHPEIVKITDKKSYKVKKHTWYNNNKFINDRLYTGGKNGYTSEAKHTLLTTFELPLSDSGSRNIAIVLLQSEKTEKDTRDILFYLLRNISYHE